MNTSSDSTSCWRAATGRRPRGTPRARHHGVRYRGVQGVHGPPNIKLGGPVIGLDPQDFSKILKFYLKIKKLIIVLKITVK